MLSMYLLGLVMALLMAWIFERRLRLAVVHHRVPLHNPLSPFHAHAHVGEGMAVPEEGRTMPYSAPILLWFLASYPKLEGGTLSEKLNHSFRHGGPVRGARNTAARFRLADRDRARSYRERFS